MYSDEVFRHPGFAHNSVECLLQVSLLPGRKLSRSHQHLVGLPWCEMSDKALKRVPLRVLDRFTFRSLWGEQVCACPHAFFADEAGIAGYNLSDVICH